jgi:glucose/arabinose dehydrogenase
MLSGLVACNSTQATLDRGSESEAIAINPKSQIAVRNLQPKPVKISISELPPPYKTESASRPPEVIPIPEKPSFQVPPGFKVNIFAENLESPRWLALTPTGEVLVTETKENRIRLLKDSNKDGVADRRTTFLSEKNGLNIPFGMSFSQDSFFVGNTDAVLRFPYKKGQQQINASGKKITDLTPGGYNQHWTRNALVAPDGKKLYVSVGSKSNADEEELPRASVQVMNLDGSERQTFASGLRNPVGLAFHPQSRELYATVNERDGLGDDLVPDYLTRVRAGEFYGWPYAYLKPNLLDPRHLQDNKSTRPDLAAKTKTPDVLFQAHSAALGLQFYNRQSFPAKYRQGAFVAFRGSWNRDRGTGYKIVFVPFDAKNRPKGYYEDFLTGFLTDVTVPTTWGRPVGLLVLPDGSLLFTEEANHRIYRIQYEPTPKSPPPSPKSPNR